MLYIIYLKEDKSFYYVNSSNNCSFQVHVMEEYELYSFSSFVADVGGFLGLLLGASLLSLFEKCFESGKKYFKNQI